MNRIRGLDAIRFVCAVWVVLGHYSFPVPHGEDNQPLLPYLIDSFLHISFAGVAAVIVFFVISGFCIHYPYRNGQKPAWGEYYFRRYVRIGVPLLSVIGTMRLTGNKLVSLESAVLWSLYAEVIYYTLYPGLMYLKERFGWFLLLITSFIASAVLAFMHPELVGISYFSPAIAWIIGLPCWLLGCRLAEQADSLTARRDGSIWGWRLAVWAVGSACMVLRFHLWISYANTLPIYSILVFFWLRAEIRNSRASTPWPFLEAAGAWSYSLYLIHYPSLWAFESTAAFFKITWPNLFLPWILSLALALALSYLFYRVVERPSHWLARQVKQKSVKDVLPPKQEQSDLPMTADRS